MEVCSVNEIAQELLACQKKVFLKRQDCFQVLLTENRQQSFQLGETCFCAIKNSQSRQPLDWSAAQLCLKAPYSLLTLPTFQCSLTASRSQNGCLSYDYHPFSRQAGRGQSKYSFLLCLLDSHLSQKLPSLRIVMCLNCYMRLPCAQKRQQGRPVFQWGLPRQMGLLLAKSKGRADCQVSICLCHKWETNSHKECLGTQDCPSYTTVSVDPHITVELISEQASVSQL